MGFPADFPAVHFFSVDLQECEELGVLLDIATLPTFLLFLRGQQVDKVAGVPQQRPARVLAHAVRQLLAAAGGPPGCSEAAGVASGATQPQEAR